MDLRTFTHCHVEGLCVCLIFFPLGIHVQLFTPCPKQDYQKMIISSKKIVALKKCFGMDTVICCSTEKNTKRIVFVILWKLSVKHVFYFNLDYNSPVTCHSWVVIYKSHLTPVKIMKNRLKPLLCVPVWTTLSMEAAKNCKGLWLTSLDVDGREKLIPDVSKK